MAGLRAAKGTITSGLNLGESGDAVDEVHQEHGLCRSLAGIHPTDDRDLKLMMRGRVTVWPHEPDMR